MKRKFKPAIDRGEIQNKVVFRQSDIVHITNLASPTTPLEFIKVIYQGLRAGFDEFRIKFDFNETQSFYPNACAPLAAFIDYYKKEGVRFDLISLPTSVTKAGVLNPPNASNSSEQITQSPLNVVWKFTDFGQVSLLTESLKREIRRQAACKDGVMEGLTWCLNEVMDNVFQHSNAPCGYVMAQIHKGSRHIAVCITDYGQGIFNSLKNSTHHPRRPADAITLAIKEGITRDSEIGQGNGLWGLHNIVRSNNGILGITSNSASYTWRNGEGHVSERVPFLSHAYGATVIDFQIDFNQPISISDSLGGYRPLDIRLEEMETEKGNILYKVAENTLGTGTRIAGERSRNEVVNIFTETQKPVEIDFHDVGILSSSFADEFVGKLVTHFGFYGFNLIFRLKNLNDTNQSILHRSVAQRLAENLKNKELFQPSE